jgi:DNA-binding CsgD family transcriptional regulator
MDASSRPLEDLRQRRETAIAQARAVLGDAGPAADVPLEHLTDALADRLVAAGDAEAEAAHERHRSRLEELRGRSEARLQALERVEAAVARLRDGTAPGAMLAAAPAELGASSDLERVVLSSVRDGVMTADVVWSRGDDPGARALLEALRSSPVRLLHPLVETDVMRRRRPALVADARSGSRVHGPTAAIMEWDGYVVAPIVVRSTVIALLHADRGARSVVDAAHRDLVSTFAGGLAQAYETASLRRMLRQERAEMSKFLEWLDVRSSELADAAIELEARPATLLASLPLSAPTPGVVDTVVFDGILTRRELEVLRLLSEGRSNRAIADELVISPGTAKFHVTRILAKLHVANRAQAVARYYALMGMRSRE